MIFVWSGSSSLWLKILSSFVLSVSVPFLLCRKTSTFGGLPVRLTSSRTHSTYGRKHDSNLL